MNRPRRREFLGFDAVTWKMILMIWFAAGVIAVVYEEHMFRMTAERELLAREVALRPATKTRGKPPEALVAAAGRPSEIRAPRVAAPPNLLSSLRGDLAAAGELAQKDLAAAGEMAAAAREMARGDLAAASDLARREVVAASAYTGGFVGFVDLLLAAGVVGAFFYATWRYADGASDDRGGARRPYAV